MKLEDMSARLRGLVVFRGILKAEIVARFRRLLETVNGAQGIEAAAEFENLLLEQGGDWTAALLDVILEDENLCIRRAADGGAGPIASACMDRELAFLEQLGGLTLDDVTGGNPAYDFLPRWATHPADFAAAYAARLAEVGEKGYGMFARYHVFTVQDGELVPVRYPDPQRLEELPGYEQEREKIIANTKALLAGLPANNVLLYGDAGTGKSSSVKAIANAFASQGLRLVEVKKNQLYQIPALMDTLARNPLKFILFIDDLSFSSNDDNFAALKAILEGSVGGRSQNIAVYATSNRRHLIKETMTDRSGDDIHEADTRQELMSLSARFGLTVTFQRPDKARYEAILLDLARQYRVQMPADQLYLKGEAFALRAGGRSPRVAKQFVELLAGGVAL
ncbi:MAG: ATP-binding protein [Gemmiger sp.]|uniref:ATP-binding protein n=1 Tax=Gemmiger sp. TaxID=2049027 RepID=UPI002E7842F0|nr:ATP-binding protein [Gemmiger sp.]MEE0801093.1 ATP-binding protein [Gemmiger sp.]